MGVLFVTTENDEQLDEEGYHPADINMDLLKKKFPQFKDIIDRSLWLAVVGDLAPTNA